MAKPPSYEESAFEYRKTSHADEPKKSQRWNSREQLYSSRSQHIASVVSQVLPLVKGRAAQGLSKTTLVLIPAGQGTCNWTLDWELKVDDQPDAVRKGVLVGFSDEAVMIHFEDCQNGTEFWSQDEAVAELRSQLLSSVSEGSPTESIAAGLPNRPAAPAKRSSIFARRSSRQSEAVAHRAESPVKADVCMDEIYFRTETEFGLYETKGVKAIVVEVDVR